MNFLYLRALVLTFCISSSMALVVPTEDDYCFAGCMQALAKQRYAGRPSIRDGGPIVEGCQNRIHTSSVLLCARAYCTPKQLESGHAYAVRSCQQAKLVYPPLSSVDNVTADDLQHMKMLQFGQRIPIIDAPIIPSRDLFQLGEHTMSWWYGAHHTHLRYCKALFIAWGCFIGIGVCIRFLLSMRNHLASPRNPNPEGESPSRPTPALQHIWNQTRARLLLPAMFSKKYRTPSWYGTIPPRAESTAIGVFIALNVILCAVSYDPFPRNLYWNQVSVQVWRLFADRTGYLSYANISVFFVFGIRNNILIWLTGWDFATFNRFHRWTARIATLQAILHSVGFTVFEFLLPDGTKAYKTEWKERYWWTGVIATITMSLILPVSIVWIRMRSYDLFLILHIYLALVTLVCLFYHTKILSPEFDGFLWPCVAFWNFDRACRIGRVLFFSMSGKVGGTTAEYSENDEIIRIDATNVFRNRMVLGGHHFFLYSPLARLGWQSHPFTLVRWRESSQDGNESGTDSSDHGSTEKSTAAVTTRQISKKLAGEERYGFLVRPMNGYTRRLCRSLAAQAGPTPTRFFFEGPYGHVPNFKRFNDVLLVIGGSGISIGISYIYNALEQNTSSKMNLTWTCRRSRSYMDSVMERELKAAMETGRLTIDAFVTGGNADIKAESAHSVTHERPDVGAVIRKAVLERRGPLAVVACGPASLADDARAAFVSELRCGNDKIELFTEAFNW